MVALHSKVGNEPGINKAGFQYSGRKKKKEEREKKKKKPFLKTQRVAEEEKDHRQF